MNGEDLADKAGIKKENRFIFSDSYYENMPEVPEKPNFDVLGLPKKDTSYKHSSVQQASSFDQIIHNDYTKNDVEPSNHMFNFFSEPNSNTKNSFNNLSTTENALNTTDSPDPFLNLSVGKNNELSSIFPGSSVLPEKGTDTSPSSDLFFHNNQLDSSMGNLNSSQLSDTSVSFKSDDFKLPSDISFSEESNDSTDPFRVHEKSGSVSSFDSSSSAANSLTGLDFLKTEVSNSSFKPDDSSSYRAVRNGLNSSGANSLTANNFPDSFNNQEKTGRTTKSDSKSDSTINIFSSEKSNNSTDFYKPEEHSNDEYFFGMSRGPFTDIEYEKTEATSINAIHTPQGLGQEESKKESIDFIQKLKNEELPVELKDSLNGFTSSSEFAMPVSEMEDKKDFLWESIPKPKIEDIKVPERKLEYDQNFMSSTPVEENRFIINGDPSVNIKENSRKESNRIPDFMSGTFQASDLNISTGVNQELEAELIKQREEEEERKRKEALESNAYPRQSKKNQQMVYKAGGKSYVREVDSKPKIELWPANQSSPSVSVSESTSTSVEIPSIISNNDSIDLKVEPEVSEEKKEEVPKEEPKSIQELIESIVNVPGLSNIEVKLNPFENPGVKFGFQEKVEKTDIAEDQPTNVYDEKADNFDYDQNFENVEVVKSTLLEELIGQSHKEGKISILARYGEDFCARDYITNPAIGRAEEIKQLILILLTPEKSGILIGKPGIGKTSIVEGLAYQLQRNNVPEALKGFRIVSVKTPSLLGSLPTGETRLQTLVDELKELDKVILFIDEIHMLIGATNDSSMDFANMFKESLGRGSIKIIGATTTEEYERYILRDKAFVRRFQKVEVEEPSREHTIKILMGTLPKIEKTTGAKLKYSEFMKTEIMSFIVDITTEYKRIYGIGSRYPDICLTLLSQAFSQAVFANRTEVNIQDIRKAIENSKNIYPDVIRKELVNFDQKFKDLIREEELGQ